MISSSAVPLKLLLTQNFAGFVDVHTNERSGNILLPRQQFTAIGIPYEIPRSTTDAETIALKAANISKCFQCYCLSVSGASWYLIWNANCSKLLSRKKNLDEPKKIQPKIVTRARLR
jgi:hypothetical protein